MSQVVQAKRKKTWRRKVSLLILLAFVLVISACVYFVRMHAARFHTNGEVVRAIIQDFLTYYLPDWPDDCPRVIVIDHGFPDAIFVVTRGRPDNETVVAAGHFDRSTWFVRERAKPPKTLWEMFPENKHATFALFSSVGPRPSQKDALANLQAFAPQETLQSVPYEDSFMWKYGVIKGWFRTDENVALIFIDRYPQMVIGSSSWGISGGLACGQARPIGFPGWSAQVNLETLKITHFMVD